MSVKEYKCGYKHCVCESIMIPASESVVVGKRRYHKECAEMHSKIERIKRIYFDYIDDKSDYVQVVGVINNLIFIKKYDVDYVEFVMKHVAIYSRNIKSPYILHTIIKKNELIKEKYNDENKRKGVNDRFAYRTGIN